MQNDSLNNTDVTICRKCGYRHDNNYCPNIGKPDRLGAPDKLLLEDIERVAAGELILPLEMLAEQLVETMRENTRLKNNIKYAAKIKYAAEMLKYGYGDYVIRGAAALKILEDHQQKESGNG